MRLVLATLGLGVLFGYLRRGSLFALGRVQVRWAPVAMLGLALQLAPGHGHIPFVMLMLSLLMLAAFAVVNLDIAGFPMIVIGLALNFLVIGVNSGMPVDPGALLRSGQADTLQLLVASGGAKQHLEGPNDELTSSGT